MLVKGPSNINFTSSWQTYQPNLYTPVWIHHYNCAICSKAYSASFHIWVIAWHNYVFSIEGFPDSKVHGANTGPTWVLSAPDRPHVGPMNLAIRFYISTHMLYWRIFSCVNVGIHMINQSSETLSLNPPQSNNAKCVLIYMPWEMWQWFQNFNCRLIVQNSNFNTPYDFFSGKCHRFINVKST